MKKLEKIAEIISCLIFLGFIGFLIVGFMIPFCIAWCIGVPIKLTYKGTPKVKYLKWFKVYDKI